MKTIKLAAFLMLAFVTLFSCTKSDPGTPVNNNNGTGGNNNNQGNNNGNQNNTPGTTLQIGVGDINGNLTSGATVIYLAPEQIGGIMFTMV
jgi:hypothetical protein